MLTPRLEELVRPSELTARVIWVGLTAPIVVYVVVAFLVTDPAASAQEPLLALQAVLIVVALIAGTVSLLLPRFLLSDERLQRVLRDDPALEDLARDPQTGKVDEERRRKIEALSTQERKLLRLPPVYLTQLIIRLALTETVAIMGLVLAIISNSPQLVVPFAALALVLNLSSLPKVKEQLESATLLVL